MSGNAISSPSAQAVVPAPVRNPSRTAAFLSSHLPAAAEPAMLTAQRVLFAGPSDLVSKDLYCAVSGHTTRRRDSITLGPCSRASGNTYFGRFAASYWQRWTDVGSVTLELTVCGSGTLIIGASDVRGSPCRIAARTIADAAVERVSLSAVLDRYFDGGALWLELETEANQELTVESARWAVDAPEVIRPTAVSICTMNRADDCLENLRVMAGDLDALETLEAVYVADQGTDPVESRDGFEQVAKELGGKLTYIRQPNLGGAGGFTRGLYEMAGQAGTEHANVLFMDDDVRLEPDIIVRMTAFANRTVKPILVGGQMLNLLHPHELHVGAEYADLNALEFGRAVPHTEWGADLLRSDPHTGRPQHQERRLGAGYNGWWSCLIPSEIVAAIGYPMPYFIQWDDVEYAYRARAKGFSTVTLPGTGVWHADFAWKDGDEWTCYFNLRNSMITAALHSPFDVTVAMRTVAARLVRQLISLQYGMAATLIKAVEDFLEGPEILRDGGVAALREVREIRARYPETIRIPAVEFAAGSAAGTDIVNPAPWPSRERAVLVKRLLWRMLGKYEHASGAVPADEAHWWHVSLFKTVAVTDASQNGVRIREYDRARMLDLARRAGRVLNRLRKEGPAIRDQYRSAAPELTSRENWARLYRL